MKEIELERQKMIQEANEKQNMNGQVMIQQPGMPPRPLALHELVEIIQQQQNEINKRGERISQTERLITEMHSKISKLLTENKEYEKKLKEMAKSNPPLDKTMRSDAFTSISESDQVELTMKKNPFLSKVIPEVMVNIT
jgi:thiamine kinase-like enzyme